jgi:His-Xaa-Ser system radical SAM maturase HxsB
MKSPPADGTPSCAPVSFRRVGGRVLITNECGDFTFLSDSEFEEFRKGRLPPGPLLDDLAERGLVASSEGLARTVRRLRSKRSFLDHGPHLHIIVLTLRCDHRCVYCHASRSGLEANELDMTEETADRVLDLVMESTSPAVTLEFQGGEPLAHFDGLRYLIEKGIDLAARRGKLLDLSLVTSMSLMDDDKASYLLDRRVQMCTSLDGPADLHDLLRPRRGTSGHELALSWLQKINSMYRQRGLDPDLYHVDGLVTVARPSLGRGREIVDEYVRLGLKTIHFRPLNPLGAARTGGARYNYSPSEFLDFYREGLDYIIGKNREGIEIQEKTASIFLKKIFDDTDPGYLDIRSPCGGAFGQVAYNHDGQIYTCDEGRMLARMGDDAFRMGAADCDSYETLMTSPAARVVCLASCLEASSSCLACAYRPYCGTCPVLNYAQQGTPYGVMPESERCQIHKGILDEIFRHLAEGGEEIRRIFERWRLSRPRPELVYGPEFPA